VRAGELKVDGDKNVARRFFALFPMPAPASDNAAR
jgi:hypothetical protein